MRRRQNVFLSNFDGKTADGFQFGASPDPGKGVWPWNHGWILMRSWSELVLFGPGHPTSGLWLSAPSATPLRDLTPPSQHEATQTSESLGRLQTFQDFSSFFSFFFPNTVGNEAGNDLRTSRIPSLCFKIPPWTLLNSPRVRGPAYPAHFKDARETACYKMEGGGRGDHWRAPYTSGNREECPLISALQRERLSSKAWRFFRTPVRRRGGGEKHSQVSGTPPVVASRIPWRGLTNPPSSPESGGFVGFCVCVCVCVCVCGGWDSLSTHARFLQIFRRARCVFLSRHYGAPWKKKQKKQIMFPL